LESEADAEYVVAKAIRDGSIDATIDHGKGFIQSNDNVDVYSTNEPEKAFHMRVDFCLQIHNEAVKAMRYPPESWKQTKEEEDASKELNEEELADLLAEDDESD
jgi:26S proteasome regulatory subunit N3